MGNLTNIVVAGASGRMGRMLISAAQENAQTTLVGVTERSGHDWIGKDLGLCLGGSALGITVSDDAEAVMKGADALLDFTTPAATINHVKAATKTECAVIIGTTGLEAEDLARIADLSKDCVVVRAGNMSLGVNLLTALTRKVAAALDADYDIEIVEAHHRHKVDAPSGTALMLGEAAAEGRGVTLENVRDSGRDGITGARNRGDIGFAVLRGGDVVGEHDVVFAGEGERITLRHVATDRMLFARGAVKAALWSHGRPNGEYSMMDVLGL